MQEDEIIEEVERNIKVDHQCVSYKWLAYEYHVNMDMAKNILAKVLKKNEKDDGMHPVYLISGHLRGKPEGSCNVTVVNQSDLKKTEESFDRIFSKHIYSIQSDESINGNALWNKDNTTLSRLVDQDEKEFFENKLSAIRYQGIGTIGQKRVVAIPAPRNVSTSSKKPVSMGGKISGTEVKRTTAQDFFGKRNTSATTPSTTSAKSASSSNDKKEAKESSKSKSSMNSFFGAAASKKDSKVVDADDNDGVAVENRTTFTKRKKKVVDSDLEEESEPEEVEPVVEKQETERPKRNLRKREPSNDNTTTDLNPQSDDEEEAFASDDEPQAVAEIDTSPPVSEATTTMRKHKGRVIDSDDDDDGDEEMREAEKERLKQEKKEAKKREREEDKKLLAKEAKFRGMERLGVTSVAQATTAGDAPKKTVKRQRTVTQTVEDDEGFLVVKQVVIEEEVEVDDVPEEKPAPALVPPSTSKPQANVSEVKKPKNVPSKQGTMNMFFRKKD